MLKPLNIVLPLKDDRHCILRIFRNKQQKKSRFLDDTFLLSDLLLLCNEYGLIYNKRVCVCVINTSKIYMFLGINL